MKGVGSSIWMVAFAFVLTARCGATAPGDMERHALQSPAGAYSCEPGGVPPPSKLILPSSGGVPGRYIVELMPNVDVASAAEELSSKYNARVIQVYTAALHGFSLNVGDAAAAQLAQESAVCWVEQDGIVRAG